MKSELDKFKLFYEAEPIFTIRHRLAAKVLYLKRKKAKKK